jgi:hypothetical protein
MYEAKPRAAHIQADHETQPYSHVLQTPAAEQNVWLPEQTLATVVYVLHISQAALKAKLRPFDQLHDRDLF